MKQDDEPTQPDTPIVTLPGFAVGDIKQLEVDGAKLADVERNGGVMVVPRSLQQWLDIITTDKNIDSDGIQHLLVKGEKTLQYALDHDYYVFVVNDKLDIAVADVDAITQGQSVPDQTEIRDHLWQLLNELKRKLYS